jgi:hypothetical protein
VCKRHLFILLMFFYALITVASNLEGKQERQIPVIIIVEVKPEIVKSEEVVPLTITVSNGLSSSIYHLTFSLTSNDWNGETYNISLVDIYRNGNTGNLYLERPKIDVPIAVSGVTKQEIRPGEKLEIQTDERKWKLRDGWLPGRYTVTIRVDNLEVDKYSTLSVLSEPVEFEIK